MAIVKGIPDIVIYAGGAFAIYYFFIREDKEKLFKDRTTVSKIHSRVLAGGFSAPKPK